MPLTAAGNSSGPQGDAACSSTPALAAKLACFAAHSLGEQPPCEGSWRLQEQWCLLNAVAIRTGTMQLLA